MQKNKATSIKRTVTGNIVIVLAFGLLIGSLFQLASAYPRVPSYPERLAYGVMMWFAASISLWAGLKYLSRDSEVRPEVRVADWTTFILLPASVIAFQWLDSFFPEECLLGSAILFVPLGVVISAMLRIFLPERQCRTAGEYISQERRE